ncbi:MAG TPA: hypothetical protein VFX43_01900 [Chitinophagaceae bacterium]|nr:hypothetical protein [Chitinophagaceae bacterium]
MQAAHHTNIIKIGNSKGIRIPKKFLESLGEKVIICSTKEGLVIRPDREGTVPPREEWDALFAKAIAAGENPEKDVFEGVENEIDYSEWEWK